MQSKIRACDFENLKIHIFKNIENRFGKKDRESKIQDDACMVNTIVVSYI